MPIIGGEGFEVLGRLQDPHELHAELTLSGYQASPTVRTKKGEWHIWTRKNYLQKPFFQKEGERLVPSDSAVAYYSRGSELSYMLMAKPGSPVNPSELERNALAINALAISSVIIEKNRGLKPALHFGGAAVLGFAGLGFGRAFGLLLNLPYIFEGIGAIGGCVGGFFISSFLYSHLRTEAALNSENFENYLYGATAAETIDKEVKARVLNEIAARAYEALPTQGVTVGKKEFWDALKMLTTCLSQREADLRRNSKESLKVGIGLQRIANLTDIQTKTGMPLQQLLNVLRPDHSRLVRYGLVLQK